MIAAALAAAVLHLAQPVDGSCAPAGLAIGAGGAELVADQRPIAGPVDRGSVVEFLVSVYNNGPEVYSGVELSLRIDSDQRVARLDGMTVEVAEDRGPWRRVVRTAGGPDFTFAAPVDSFPLPVAVSRNFQVRLHLDPTQPGSIRPAVVLAITGRDCEVRAGFDLDVRRPETVVAAPNRAVPLLLGLVVGAMGAFAGYRFWSRRQPMRLARRARS